MAILRKSKALWIKKNAAKRKAQQFLNNAVRDGRKTKSSSCEQCGDNESIHGHHEDYSKPLDVMWLCPLCHSKIHKAKRESQTKTVGHYGK